MHKVYTIIEMFLEFFKLLQVRGVLLGVLMICGSVIAEVGDPCENKNYEGICTLASKCVTLEQNMITLGLKSNDVISCGFATYEELICCPSPATTTTTTTTTTTIKPLINWNQNSDSLQHFDLNKLLAGNNNNARSPEVPTNINPTDSNNPFAPFNFRPWTEQKPLESSIQGSSTDRQATVFFGNQQEQLFNPQNPQQSLGNQNIAPERPFWGNNDNSNTFIIQQQLPQNQLQPLERAAPTNLAERRVTQIFDTNRDWSNALAWPTNDASGTASNQQQQFSHPQNHQQSLENQNNAARSTSWVNNDGLGAINRQNHQQSLGNQNIASGRPLWGNSDNSNTFTIQQQLPQNQLQPLERAVPTSLAEGRMTEIFDTNRNWSNAVAWPTDNASGIASNQQQQFTNPQNHQQTLGNRDNGAGRTSWVNNDGIGAINAQNRQQSLGNRDNGAGRSLWINNAGFASNIGSNQQQLFPSPINSQQALARSTDDDLVEKTIKSIFRTDGNWNSDARRLPNNNW